MKIPLVPIAILAGQAFIANATGSGPLGKFAAFAKMYTGIDASNPTFAFDPGALAVGYGPWAAYGLIKKFVFPFANPNHALSTMHLPVRI